LPIVTSSIDFDGNEGGIFSQEPFKSNKDRFNLWYVDVREPYSRDCFENANNGECNSLAAITAAHCILTNKYTTAIFDTSFRSFAQIFSSTSIVSNDANAAGPVPHVVSHEFGHTFGRVWDEYEEIGNTYSGSQSFDRNIYLGTSNGCLSQSQWKNFEGNGCGQDGTIDCIENYDPSAKSVSCNTGNNICYTEIGCFEGARQYSEGGFRSTYNTVMRYAGLAINSNSPRAFGQVNERFICDEIEAVTGSVGGICNSIPRFEAR